MTQTHIWLRDEVKEFEKRVALSPRDAERLIKEHNFLISAERSTTRIFKDEEYERVGCKMIPSNSWVVDAPSAQENRHTFVLGLKELPNPSASIPKALKHRHVFFAHCYKYQGDWKDTMERFVEGNGEIIDLEFLTLDNGRRIAAFGVAAGFAGMAAGLLAWANQQMRGQNLTALEPYSHKDELIKDVNNLLDKIGRRPSVLVLGALGRCGRGSVEMAELAGITEILKWDLEETKSGGPFPQMIHDVDILVNDVYLMPGSKKTVPFITTEALQKADQEGTRKLSVFVDVSCDVSNPDNPFPINNKITTFDKPCRRIIEGDREKSILPLDVIAIDHLPSLTPRESSIDFSSQLVEYLKDLPSIDFSKILGKEELALKFADDTTERQRVWLRARALFYNKKQEYLQNK